MFSSAKAKAKATRGRLAKAKPQGEKATAITLIKIDPGK